MTTEEHKEKHAKLHRCLDELVADYIRHTEKLPSNISLMEFMQWAFEQATNPTEG